MGYFRENTAIIEAEEWDASNIEPNGLIDIGLHSGSLRRNPDGALLVRTSSWGDYNAKPGDWIVKDERGKLRIPRSKEVLERFYTPVVLPDEAKNETVYSAEDKKAIVKALEAVASVLSLSFYDTDMKLAIANKLNDLDDAILELKGNDQSLKD